MGEVFDPKQVAVSFRGVNGSGWGDGQFLAAAKNEEGFFLKVGADGEYGVAVNANESGRVTVTTLNTGPFNDFLTNCANLKLRGPLMISDLSGRMKISAPVAWVVKVADVNKSKNVETNAWIFEGGKMTISNNGNNPA